MKQKSSGKVFLYVLLYLVTLAILASTILLTKEPRNTAAFAAIRLVIILFASILLLKYTLYMLISPWFEYLTAQRRKQLPHLYHYQPLVSVIIPAWNEEVGLLSTLKSLLQSV